MPGSRVRVPPLLFTDPDPMTRSSGFMPPKPEAGCPPRISSSPTSSGLRAGLLVGIIAFGEYHGSASLRRHVRSDPVRALLRQQQESEGARHHARPRMRFLFGWLRGWFEISSYRVDLMASRVERHRPCPLAGGNRTNNTELGGTVFVDHRQCASAVRRKCQSGLFIECIAVNTLTNWHRRDHTARCDIGNSHDLAVASAKKQLMGAVDRQSSRLSARRH